MFVPSAYGVGLGNGFIFGTQAYSSMMLTAVDDGWLYDKYCSKTISGVPGGTIVLDDAVDVGMIAFYYTHKDTVVDVRSRSELPDCIYRTMDWLSDRLAHGVVDKEERYATEVAMLDGLGLARIGVDEYCTGSADAEFVKRYKESIMSRDLPDIDFHDAPVGAVGFLSSDGSDGEYDFLRYVRNSTVAALVGYARCFGRDDGLMCKYKYMLYKYKSSASYGFNVSSNKRGSNNAIVSFQ